jgi:hypothetical protein
MGAGIIQTLFASVMFGMTHALALAFGLAGREPAPNTSTTPATPPTPSAPTPVG